MIDKKILTRQEITNLVASIMEYNGLRAAEFRFVSASGETMLDDFTVEVAYDSSPLKVRVVPESQDDETRVQSLDQAMRMVDEWRRQRRAPAAQQS